MFRREQTARGPTHSTFKRSVTDAMCCVNGSKKKKIHRLTCCCSEIIKKKRRLAMDDSD